ncbi:MAG TPA: GNAT family N-acetyltransferase [Thermoflexia bacterium]|nr:GNAT family N-acetyltransferase [Thermoflexia bacterium]
MTAKKRSVELFPATAFPIETLTETYNRARIDYIVPMPMNVARMRAYIHNYDVELESSVIATLGREIVGLGMLGVRDQRAWITRLGVAPNKRRNNAGQGMMEYLIQQAKERGAQQVTLEVIKDNWPAFYLFKKLGFHVTRELLVLRRPPIKAQLKRKPYTLTFLDAATVSALLEGRQSQPSWLDELPSLRKAGNLEGLKIRLVDGSYGWVAYQHALYQLARIVLQPETGDKMTVAHALLHALHTRHLLHDTKLENLPAVDPYRKVFEEFGYLVSFTRIEMHLDLS